MLPTVKILLVEDDESLQAGIRDLLEIALYDDYDLYTATAGEGFAALAKMETFIPDLIISDIMMPKMDGFEFLAAVRKNPQWIQIPFIFLTAKGKKSDIVEGHLSGAELYITKPFDSGELIDLVHTQIKRSFEQRKAREQAKHSLQRQLLQLINHEFRTPLTYVTAYYEMLADSVAHYQDRANMEDYLRGIQSGCERLTDLIEDLVMVVDIKSGAAAQWYKDTAEEIQNLPELIQTAADAHTSLAQQNKIEVLFDLDETLPPIWGSPAQLELIFSHLLENAIKFTIYPVQQENRRGQVKISAKAVGNDIVVVINDNGIGIPATVKDEIFELFFQHNRQFYEQQGSGAGLTIVQGLLKFHHGQIDIESVENEGTTISVRLPLEQAEETATIDESDEDRRRAHILIVEDDYHLLIGLKELLQIFWGPYELELSTAMDGIDALKEIKAKTPDLIVSDIMMPNMNGYELLETVRQNPEWLHIPFIFLTARSERKDIVTGLQRGAEQYITKPYDSEELLALISAQLNRYFQLQEITDQDFDIFKQSILNILQPEFRAPLSSVNGYSERFANGLQSVETADQLTESLRGIQQGSRLINEYVEDFIALAEIKTGETMSVYENRSFRSLDMGYIIEESHLTWKQKQQECDLNFEVHLGAQTHPIRIDLETIQRALIRLHNILRMICEEQEGRTITLHSQETDSGFVITLSHDGQPLDVERVEMIKAIIVDHDESGLDAIPYGHWLGIVNGIIETHHGTLTFKSAHLPENEHDHFAILLPAAESKNPMEDLLLPDPFV